MYDSALDVVSQVLNFHSQLSNFANLRGMPRAVPLGLFT